MSGERREVRDKCFSLLFGFKYDEEASAGMVGAFLLRTPPPTQGPTPTLPVREGEVRKGEEDPPRPSLQGGRKRRGGDGLTGGGFLGEG